MAGKGKGSCSSCLMETKYACLKCDKFCCTRCGEFEDNEETPGLAAAKCIGYCETCCLSRLDEESDEEIHVSETKSTAYNNINESSGKVVKDFSNSLKGLKELVNETLSDDEVEVNTTVKQKKKPARKSSWSPEVIDDFIDIVVNNEVYQKKLIFTNTKNQKNGEIYQKILGELKQAALTVKTATGVRRFQEERGFGKWFNTLFALVQSRDSCKPDLALEPSSFEKANDETSKGDGKEGMFILVRKRQKVKASDKLGETAIEAMNVVKESLKNNPTNDLIAFMREEMEKSREHELKLVGLMQSSRQNNTPFHVPQQMTSSMPYLEGSPVVATTSFPTWNIAICGQNQPAAYQNSEVTCTTIRRSQPISETSPAGIHCDGQKTYQKL